MQKDNFFLQFPDLLMRHDEHFKKLDTGIQQLTEGWISCNFIAEVYRHTGTGEEMISINCVSKGSDGRWIGDITWDELMQVKREISRGEAFAIEIFPSDSDVIDTNNIRHLWVISDKALAELPFIWASKLKKKGFKDYKLDYNDLQNNDLVELYIVVTGHDYDSGYPDEWEVQVKKIIVAQDNKLGGE
jgi:hypothetical protein